MLRVLRVGFVGVLAMAAAAGTVRADSDQDGEQGVEGYIGIKGHYQNNTFNDLELTDRGFGQNGLGLTFADATTQAQDNNRTIHWSSNVLLAELHGYPLGDRRLDLFAGAGYAFGDEDDDVPGTKESAEGFAWSAGISGIPLQIGMVSFELDARYTAATEESNDENTGAGAGINESHDLDWWSFEANALIAFTLETDGPTYIKPYGGIKYHHLEMDEDIRLNNAAGTASSINLQYQSEVSADFRGVAGVLISGVWAQNVSIRFEGSVGKDVYGAQVGLEYSY